jgi:hypothetical protein
MNLQRTLFVAMLVTLGSATLCATLCAGAQVASPGVITQDEINLRSGPGPTHARSGSLAAMEDVVEIERSEGWSKIRRADGTTGWIGSQYLRLNGPPAASTQPASGEVPASGTEPNAVKSSAAPPRSRRDGTNTRYKATTSASAATPSRSPVINRAAAVTTPSSPNGSATPSKSAAAAATPASTVSAKAGNAGTSPKPAGQPGTAQKGKEQITGLLVDTKKDPFGGATSSVGFGDAFRLLFYLLPILGLVVLAVRGLKKVQDRTGGAPGGWSSMRGSMVGGFNLSNARKTGGSNIRVVESVRVGSIELSLVEVQGRSLLLSTAGGAASLLLELKDGASGESEFQSMLGSLTQDEGADDLDGTIGATVGSLDDRLRETREAIVRSAQKTLGRETVGGTAEWRS